jgi:small-conductance mechanosensitive channel
MTFLDIAVNLPDGTKLRLDELIGTLGAVVAIVVAAAIVIRLAHVFVRRIVKAMLNRELLEGAARDLTDADMKKRQGTIDSLAVNVIRLFVIVVAGLMILETAFRVDIGPAIAGLGIAGIAIGLGTQSLVRDYLNGALIMIENQYAIGDVVNVAGIGGVVEDFTLRRTTLRDMSGTVHTIPNGQITVASNLTRAWARVNEEVQVAYGTDVERARAVIDGVGQDMAADPTLAEQIIEAPHVERINELGDRGITFLILGKVRAAAQWSTSGELRRRLLRAFDENRIEMPTGVLLTWSGQTLGDSAEGAPTRRSGASGRGAGRRARPGRGS